ncbi:MAG: hypothetical protein CM1200mP11_3640 [Nitrosopumilaceae archaeon]|nr:MAG: hypothetical protein CM1200mP11_3640 [Nitrosopumilaceae archaeon]
MGLIFPGKKNFLSDLRKITKENNIPLIFDEVVTGFRVSSGGAQEHFGIKPDITTLAKALSNGFYNFSCWWKKGNHESVISKWKYVSGKYFCW